MLDVCGIDWATTRARRFGVRLEVRASKGELEVVEVHDRLEEADVHRICGDATLDSVGVDVAFGWPRDFCRFVADWRPGEAEDTAPVEPNRFMFRRTDRVVSESGLGRPLSVSTNLLGRSAQSWTHQFLAEEGPERDQIDVLGAARRSDEDPPRLVEVYPKATLNAFQRHAATASALGLDTYDRRDVDARTALVAGLGPSVGLTGVEAASFASNEHRVDALLAAVATAIYASACRRQSELFRGWEVRRPSRRERDDARREGWIFFPLRDGRPAEGQ